MTLKKILAGLSEEQRAFVTHLKGPAIGIAGAGAGKTLCLVRRMAYLIHKGVEPSHILLITFTNKAANEIKKRVQSYAAAGSTVEARTFHSFAYETWREFGHHLLPASKATLLEEDEAKAKINELFLKGLTPKNKDQDAPSPAVVARVMSYARNNLMTIKASLNRHSPRHIDFLEAIAKAATAYQKFKRAHNYLDFDDMICLTVKLLRANPVIRKEVRRRYAHIMIDEFQDTNRIQARLVELIGGRTVKGAKRNIVAVGDPGQCIFEFQGASIFNIDHFHQQWNAKILPLVENYRSTQQILDLANAIDRTEIEGQRRRLRSALGKVGLKPTLKQYSTLHAEADEIAKAVIHHKAANGILYREQAVLYRSSSLMGVLEERLIARGIRYRLVGGQAIADAAHVRDVLAVMRARVNPKDSIALTRVLQLIPGIGPKKATAIAKTLGNARKVLPRLARALRVYGGPGRSLYAAFKAAFANKLVLSKRVAKIVGKLRPLLRGVARYADNIEDRLEQLQTLSIIASEFSNSRAFLTALSMNRPNFSAPGVRNQVAQDDLLTVSTIHSAKGLEWDAVFIPGLNQGVLPSQRALPQGLSEERRIFYVATTRARQHLHLSRSEFSARGKGARRSRTSCFLTGELHAHLQAA